MSGTLTTAGKPITVQGADTTIMSGQINGGTVLAKSGTGTLTLGGAGSNVGVSGSFGGALTDGAFARAFFASAGGPR